MNLKNRTATSMSEVLVTLGLIGLLAVTMLGLNNFGDQGRINEAKMANAAASIKAWGKAISKSNETGLEMAKVLENQASMDLSLGDFLNVKTVEADDFKVNGETITDPSGFLFDNGVNMAARQIRPTCDSSKAGGEPCGLISLKIEDLSSNYAVFSDGAKSEDELFVGYEKVPYIPAGTVIDDSDPDNPVVCLSASGCYCLQTPCVNPQPAPEGTCSEAENVYIAPIKNEACAVGQNGSIITNKVTSLLGKEITTTIDSCCDNPKIAQFDVNGEKDCVCNALASIIEAGYGFDKKSSNCQTICEKGTYSTGGKGVSCQLCEPNKYCDENGLGASKNCPKGYYCPNDLKKEVSNKYHSDKYIKEKSAVVEVKDGGLVDKVICPVGYYCPEENANAPIVCPKGHYCPEEGMTEAKKCPAGTYQDEEGQTSCKTCDANYYCATPGLEKQTPCDSGSYSDEGSTFCTQCSVGNYFDSAKQGCQPCPMGQYQDLYGQTSCKLCALGTYQDAEGQTSCKVCDIGTYQDVEGQATCKLCDVGTYQDEKAQTSCKVCDIGTYQDAEGQTSCKICEIGSYADSSGMEICSNCPANSTTTATSSSSVENCLCKAGYGLENQIAFSKDVNGNIVGECKLVPCGSYSPENTNEIFECPDTDDNRFDVGYTTKKGSKSQKDCKVRETNEYWTDKTQCSVKQCPKGKIPNSTNTGCQCPARNCPAGQVLDEKTCECVYSYMCPVYDKVYVVRWKTMVAPEEIEKTDSKYLPTVYNQLAGSLDISSSVISVINSSGKKSKTNNRKRNTTEGMKKVAAMLNNHDKNLSFDKFYAHVVGVNYETVINELEYDYLANSSSAFAVCIDNKGNVLNVSEKEMSLANAKKFCGTSGHVPTEAEMKKHFAKIKQATTIDGKIWTTSPYSYRKIAYYNPNGYTYKKINVKHSFPAFETVEKASYEKNAYLLICKNGTLYLNDKGSQTSAKHSVAQDFCKNKGGYPSALEIEKFVLNGTITKTGYYRIGATKLHHVPSIPAVKLADSTWNSDNYIICKNGTTKGDTTLSSYSEAYQFCQKAGSSLASVEDIKRFISQKLLPANGDYYTAAVKNSKTVKLISDKSFENKERVVICKNSQTSSANTMTFVEAYNFCQKNGGLPSFSDFEKLPKYLIGPVYYWTTDVVNATTSYSKVYNVAQKINAAKVITSVTPRAWFYKVASGLSEDDGANMLISQASNGMCDPVLHTVNSKGECVCKKAAAIQKIPGYEDYFDGARYDAGFLACKAADINSAAGMKQSDYTDVNSETSCDIICLKDLCPYKPVAQTNADGSVKKDKNGKILYVENKYIRSCNANEQKELLASNDYLTCIYSCEYYRSDNLYSTCRNRSAWSLGTEFCTGGTIACSANTSQKYVVAEIFRRYDTPLILDLKGDGYKFTTLEDGVDFDIDGDGYIQKVAWTDIQTEFDDAFLILDKNKNGQVDDGKELFGDQNGAQTGFDELRKYDDNGDSVINKKDKAYFEMQLWCDMNKDAIVDEGELKTLEEAGVTELSVNFTMEKDKNGNLLTDIYGNITGLVGQFKMFLEDAAGKLVEVVRKMIDVLLMSS